MSALDSLVANLNDVIDNRAVATTVTTAAVLAAVGGLSRLAVRYVWHRRSVSVTTIFDQAVNIKTQNIRIVVSRGSGDDSGAPPQEGTVESIAILRIANSGSEKIELASAANDRFRINFPGRTIRAIKVREPDELVGEPGRPLRPDRFNDFREHITTDKCVPRGGESGESTLVVPNQVVLKRKEAFQLAVFLSGAAIDSRNRVVVDGELDRGRIIHRRISTWRRAWAAAVPVALALALALSFGIGDLTANRALTPAATCVGDLPLNIEGSTAFAHVVTEAKTDYQRLCPAARITITADGSDAAIRDNSTGLPDNTLLMVDYSGQLSQTVPTAWKANPIGMVIFGVVVNNAYSRIVAGTYALRTGYSRADLAKLYQDASAGVSVPYAAVGRNENSGTAAAFDSWTGLDSTVLTGANGCPPISATTTDPGTQPSFKGLCDVGTTQKMLDFVNDNPNAIGFADIDAVTQYPSLFTLPIDGVPPDRAHVLNGSYGFTVPEYLYTTQHPSAQLSAFLAFLQSPVEAEQLMAHDAGFIPCADLSGAVAGDCGATQ